MANCPACNAKVKAEFAFCPNCGHNLRAPVICPSCQTSNEPTARFCVSCGATLSTAASSPASIPDLIELEPPPTFGITIEFPFSSSQSFDFAVAEARKHPSFKQFGEGKKAIYRVSIPDQADLAELVELATQLKGWRSRVVYVNGEKVQWDSVFGFMWCYSSRATSFDATKYCFGHFAPSYQAQYNIWGCIQANMPFSDFADWFAFGKWVGENGDWEFDKERIRHELLVRLHNVRMCPALRADLIQDALAAIPDRVNPKKDKGWKFVEDYSYGATITFNLFDGSSQDKVVYKSVAPEGTDALKEILKRMKYGSELALPR